MRLPAKSNDLLSNNDLPAGGESQKTNTFPFSEGEVAQFIRDYEWESSELGPIDGWEPALRFAVTNCLASSLASAVLWGPRFLILYNDAYRATLNGDHPACYGRPVAELWGPKIWGQVAADFRNSFVTGANFEARGVPLDMMRKGKRETTFWDFTTSPIRDENGALVGLYNQGFENSSLVYAAKLAEARLEAGESLGRQILDSAIDFAIIAIDLGGCVTRWNVGAERILGWTEAEMMGQRIDRLFTEEDRALGRVETEMRLARTKGSGADERWRVRKDGRRFWARGKMTPLLDHSSNCVGFVKILRDRTVQRLQAARLQLLVTASEGLLAAERPDDVINAALEASTRLLDVDRCVSVAVEADGRFRLTYSSDPVAGTVDDTLCRAIVAAREPLIVGDVQASSDPLAAQSRAAGLDSVAAYPVLINDVVIGILAFGALPGNQFDAEALAFFSTLAHYVSIVREREERRAALEDINATLERRIDERSRALMVAEEHLRQSQKMEAVGHLTGGIAHDFNNLLTAIGGSLELLSMRLGNGRTDKLEPLIASAIRSTDRAAALTHRLLAFSRRQTLDPRPTDINGLIDGMEDLISRTVGPAIHVTVEADPDLWTARVDQNQLENALLNLCINARDAMPDGGRIAIETGNRLVDADTARRYDIAPGRYIVIRVGDTGMGMTPDIIARAFDPFFTTKPFGQGTGLGLSMIYGFMRQSGGHVVASSALGRGTDMHLFLPRHDADDDLGPGAASGGDGNVESLRQTVLVVDDEPGVRFLVTEVLNDLGYIAIEAADGPSALRILDSKRPINLLITDVGLPGGLNGRQLAEVALTDRPGLPILLITGYAETAVLGADTLGPRMQLLTKPFTLTAVSDRIKALLP